MLNGIDVSSYQNTVDWDEWKKKGIGFAIAKATEGLTFRDSRFARNWSELKRVGLVRGAYHFAHPGNGADAEAEAFLTFVREHGLGYGDLLALDLEDDDGESAAHVASFARAWCARVTKETGRKPLVYTYISFAHEGNCAGLGSYPLWLGDPSASPGKPRVPDPWQNWLIHQYGIDPVDVDVAQVSSAAELRGYGVGDDLARVVSLGAGRDQPVAAGGAQSIEWYAEFSDRHHVHAEDGSSVIVDEEYWMVGDALVRVTGLRPGDPIDIAWTRMTRDGTAVRDDAWRVTYHADVAGGLRVSHMGQIGIGDDVRLRLRVYNSNTYPVTVAADTMAKCALLTF